MVCKVCSKNSLSDTALRAAAIVLCKRGERTFFVYGFAKSELANITDGDLVGFRKIAGKRLSENEEAIRKHIESGALIEITEET